MMMSASWPSVVAAMWRTAVLRLAMSPLPVLPRVTPQSITMCCGPFADGTVTRKKSPNPTRYMRIRSSCLPGLPVFFALGFFAVLAATVLRGLVGFAVRLVALVAMSEPPVRHREVDLEAVFVGALDETEPLE